MVKKKNLSFFVINCEIYKQFMSENCFYTIFVFSVVPSQDAGFVLKYQLFSILVLSCICEG